MPIPEPNTAWLPAPWDEAAVAHATNDVWWTGDVDAIRKHYSSADSGKLTHQTRSGQTAVGGVRGAFSRLWYGRPVSASSSTQSSIHVPAPSDLATAFSDLAWSEGVKLSLEGEGNVTANDRLQELAASDEALETYSYMGELKSVFGATVLVPRWDVELEDHVWLEVSAADVVVPEFRSGRLTGVTLWTEYQENSLYYRHLEYHGREGGVGYIEHALFLGTKSNLGRRVDLAAHPKTESWASVVDSSSRIATNLDRLSAVYNLNLPARAWRKKGDLAFAGRSDFGRPLHGLFDSLDMTMSSWMREVKLSGSKLAIDQSVLATLDGPGSGGFADVFSEVILKVNAPQVAGTDKQGAIDKLDFEFQTDRFENTMHGLYREILKASGLSAAIWGEYGSTLQTATEVNDKDKASEKTRGKRLLRDKRALAQAASIQLELDGLVFPGKGGGRFELPEVEFPSVSKEDPAVLAETINYLTAAKAISTYRKVELFNPDWDKDQIDEEVKLILKENPVALELGDPGDPFASGSGGGQNEDDDPEGDFDPTDD